MAIYVYVEPNELDAKIAVNDGAVIFRCTIPNPEAVYADWMILDGSGTEKYDSGTERILENTRTITFFTTALGLGTYLLEISDYSKGYRCEFELTDVKRPSYFDWTIPKKSGENIRVSADEWNAFLDHVNTVRVYCGLNEASFKNVTAHTLTGRNVVTKAEVNAGVVNKNSLISYDNIRDVVDAILGKDDKYMGIGVSSEYESLINIQKGDRISADFFNNLRDAVNSVLKQ